MKRVLEMIFKRVDGRTAKISIPEAREDISPQEVKTLMEGMINKAIFMPSDIPLASVEGAKMIVTQEEALELQ